MVVRAMILLALTFALAGCNTISGIGQDVEAAGEAITGKAEETKEKL